VQAERPISRPILFPVKRQRDSQTKMLPYPKQVKPKPKPKLKPKASSKLSNMAEKQESNADYVFQPNPTRRRKERTLKRRVKGAKLKG